MKEFKIEVNVKVYQYDELSVEDKELVERAKDATRHSYARYSRFYVGAALRLEDGTIQIGANQENAAYPQAYAPSGQPYLQHGRCSPISLLLHLPSQPAMIRASSLRPLLLAGLAAR